MVASVTMTAGLVIRVAWVFGVLALSSWDSALAQAPIPDSLVRFWRQNAPLCAAGSGWRSFPSKHSCEDHEDGDMTLFNGLLCAAGETAGCDAVADAQRADGRWFRSPKRRAILESGVCDDSFDSDPSSAGARQYDRYCRNTLSPDMALGIQLYVAATNDVRRLAQWTQWLDEHRPEAKKVFGIIVGLWPRYCTDDVCRKEPGTNDCVAGESSRGCTMRPGDLAVLGQTMRHFKLPRVGLGFQELLDSASANTFTIAPLDGLLNDTGFSLHLTGVTVLTLRRLGHTNDRLAQTAQILTERQPKNPFFAYLHEGSTPRVRDMTVAVCPDKIADISQERNEWAWERADSKDAWRHSMLWDCIFMAKLLEQP